MTENWCSLWRSFQQWGAKCRKNFDNEREKRRCRFWISNYFKIPPDQTCFSLNPAESAARLQRPIMHLFLTSRSILVSPLLLTAPEQLMTSHLVFLDKVIESLRFPPGKWVFLETSVKTWVSKASKYHFFLQLISQKGNKIQKYLNITSKHHHTAGVFQLSHLEILSFKTETKKSF